MSEGSRKRLTRTEMFRHNTFNGLNVCTTQKGYPKKVAWFGKAHLERIQKKKGEGAAW